MTSFVDTRKPKALVKRRKDEDGKIRVTGKAQDLQESAAYPVDFGYAMVPFLAEHISSSVPCTHMCPAIKAAAAADRFASKHPRAVAG